MEISSVSTLIHALPESRSSTWPLLQDASCLAPVVLDMIIRHISRRYNMAVIPLMRAHIFHLLETGLIRLFFKQEGEMTHYEKVALKRTPIGEFVCSVASSWALGAEGRQLHRFSNHCGYLTLYLLLESFEEGFHSFTLRQRSMGSHTGAEPGTALALARSLAKNASAIGIATALGQATETARCAP